MLNTSNIKLSPVDWTWICL